jgi:beta-glucanase (GH16 family)
LLLAALTLLLASAPAAAAHRQAQRKHHKAAHLALCRSHRHPRFAGSRFVGRRGARAPARPVPAPAPAAARPALAPAPTRAPTPAAATTPLPVGVIGSWKLKFADEFNANKLDGSKWSTGWFGSGVTQAVDTADELNCYDPRQVGVAGGELDITAIAKPERCGGVLQPYATGLINSDGKFNFTYGAY